jgi:hypothetical protein
LADDGPKVGGQGDSFAVGVEGYDQLLGVFADVGNVFPEGGDVCAEVADVCAKVADFFAGGTDAWPLNLANQTKHQKTWKKGAMSPFMLFFFRIV